MSGHGSGRDPAAPEEVHAGLRRLVFDLDPADAGITSTAALPRVWGAMVEMGQPNGSATLVALADGTTSLYTSTGGGIIGAGAHAQVAAATEALLRTVERHLDQVAATADRSPPGPGRVAIRALTYQGPRAAEAAEDDLGSGRHALSPVFYAAHAVITELRLLQQAQQ